MLRTFKINLYVYVLTKLRLNSALKNVRFEELTYTDIGSSVQFQKVYFVKNLIKVI